MKRGYPPDPPSNFPTILKRFSWLLFLLEKGVVDIEKRFYLWKDEGRDFPRSSKLSKGLRAFIGFFLNHAAEKSKNQLRSPFLWRVMILVWRWPGKIRGKGAGAPLWVQIKETNRYDFHSYLLSWREFVRHNWVTDLQITCGSEAAAARRETPGWVAHKRQ